MLLQTNTYVVPKEKRAEHARLMLRFRQCFRRLGSVFEVYEQAGPGFSGDGGGRFVQIMRFRDRHHQQEVHAREQKDPVAQQLIADFCQLVNLSYQQQHGLFASAYYAGILPDRPSDHADRVSTPADRPAGGDAGSDNAEAEEIETAQLAAESAESESAVEEAFGPFLREDDPEFRVEQQVDPMDSFEPRSVDEPGEGEPPERHHSERRPADPRPMPR